MRQLIGHRFYFPFVIQREYEEYLSWTTVHEISIFSYPRFRGKKNLYQNKGGGKKKDAYLPFFATIAKQREIPTEKMLVDKVERFN